MKKYNRPEIEALALEVIDVIETSGGEKSVAKMLEDTATFGTIVGDVQVVNQNIAAMDNQWQW